MSGPFVDQALQPGDQAAYPELTADESVESTETTSLLASKYPAFPPSPPASTHQAPLDPNMSLSDAQHTAQNTMDSIKNSQTVQTVANGPVAEKARAEANATRNEFGNLSASKQTPQTTTANGQELTHYHSFFYNLLSWENPRATAITYTTFVLSILIARYVPVIRYLLKASYIVLGITAALEGVGRLALGQGVASKMRPRAYYRIPPETVESILSDLAELVNFFVIEFQRIVFAENISATILAFLSAFTTYWLVKIMPAWGFILLSTTVLFFTPLVYITNKELIDEYLGNAQKIASEQVSQVRGLAAEHTGKAWEASQNALKNVSAQASEAIGQGKQAAVDKGIVSPQTAEKVTPESAVKSDDFPSAPKDHPLVPEATTHEDIHNSGEKEPLLA
ncbi:hypothetical protein AC578_2564 [Pseudocercospora eumusae]|uniref:Reticulon-like protein n=1 Tax=Pseudocercospora eumusae TaxID=321146 RepID=A0A139HHP8_9PEZI|nr:hypothetical protein AC578_2564 [Pseudocercospora eumusae]